jgi:hypothetical protein
VPQPVEPLGYGVDLVCVDDLTEALDEEDPESVEGIMHSCVRFLTTDRDSIPDAPGRGYNVRRLLNRAFTGPELEAEQGLAMAELEQDDRIQRATVVFEINYATRAIKVRFHVVPRSLALQPFDFVASVTDGASHLELLK